MSVLDRMTEMVESGGNPNARNPRSSATGLGQFIDSTWLNTIQRHRPDIAQGRSRADVLALRTDPTLSREMLAAHRGDNQAGLRSSGIDPNPANTYLAHFAGLGGAKKVLGADPTTPVRSLLGDSVVRANPFLANYSAADLQNWAAAKMSGKRGPRGSLADGNEGVVSTGHQPGALLDGIGGDPAQMRAMLRQLFGVESDDEMFKAFDGVLAQLAGDAGLDFGNPNG